MKNRTLGINGLTHVSLQLLKWLMDSVNLPVTGSLTKISGDTSIKARIYTPILIDNSKSTCTCTQIEKFSPIPFLANLVTNNNNSEHEFMIIITYYGVI